MQYRESPPPPRLLPFVECFWTLVGEGSGSSQRVIPDGRPELILNLGEPFEALGDQGVWQKQPRCFFTGQIQGPLLLKPSSNASVFAARFHPAGASAVLDLPLDKFTELRDVECMQDVEALLQPRKSDPLVIAAVDVIVAKRGLVEISTLTRGLSARQFERRFLKAVGLAPKLFCRMQRFVHAFRAIEQQPDDWASVAVAHGYYDQSHLIRDCKEFAGYTPTLLQSQDVDLARHFLMSHSSNTSGAVSG